eukprot:777213-Rhodomonas_salina.4
MAGALPYSYPPTRRLRAVRYGHSVCCYAMYCAGAAFAATCLLRHVQYGHSVCCNTLATRCPVRA